MRMTSRELVAATFARQTSLPIDKIADIVKRLHASADIIRKNAHAGAGAAQAGQRAIKWLGPTGWTFDVGNPKAPAIVRGSQRIEIV